MPRLRSEIENDAVDWLIRLRDGGDADWDAFTDWLEADPEHAAVYDEVALADDALGALPRQSSRPMLVPQPAPGPMPVQRVQMPRRAFLGWGIAAAIAGAVSLTVLTLGGDTYQVATSAGERRSVALSDGSRIDLNGATRLTLDRDDPRFARLEGGEALFSVRHDDERPFRVEIGDARLVDLGTVFNVVLGGDGLLDVAVAEGAVRYEAADEALELGEGSVLRRRPGRAPELGRRAAEAITGWREGRLTFSDSSLDEVADSLSRNLGVTVSAEDSVGDRRFSGVIQLDRDAERLFERVSALLGTGARRNGDGWILTAGDADTR